jgi:hypothetical protein
LGIAEAAISAVSAGLASGYFPPAGALERPPPDGLPVVLNHLRCLGPFLIRPYLGHLNLFP